MNMEQGENEELETFKFEHINILHQFLPLTHLLEPNSSSKEIVLF